MPSFHSLPANKPKKCEFRVIVELNLSLVSEVTGKVELTRRDSWKEAA